MKAYSTSIFVCLLVFSSTVRLEYCVSPRLAPDTQRGLLSKWSTPQPRAMPTSSPGYASNREMDDTQPSAAFLSPPLFLHEWKEMNSAKWNVPSSLWRQRKWGLEEALGGQPITIQQWPRQSRAVRVKQKQVERRVKLLMLLSYQYGLWRVNELLDSPQSQSCAGIKCSFCKTTWQ